MSKTAQQHYKSRLRAEARFKWYGRVALAFAVFCLVVLLGSISWRGVAGFMHTQVVMTIALDPALLELEDGENVQDLSPARFNGMLRGAIADAFPALMADPSNQRDLIKLFGSGAGMEIKQLVDRDPSVLGTRQSIILPAGNVATLFMADSQHPELSDAQREALSILHDKGALTRGFDWDFFTQADSRSPENAGFFGAMAGSFFTMIVCLLAAFPIGVMAAVYLEEFSRKSILCQIIEVNVNNLAAVPSIVYGLLGLAVYINFMHLPRSASLVGGLTLALMAFPVIIIATRTALKSIPPSIKQGALALGASPVQVVWHHSLPLSMPGIMTGTILGMARAIGETAPLLMIGMVAFVADIPGNFTSAATAMPVQVYLWATSPEAGFAEKTAAGILVLLALLLMMNALAIYLRKKFEVRW